MTTITLNTPIIIVPAQEAVTASTFVVKYIEENYGVDYDEENPGRGMGRGYPRSVSADIEIGTGPGSRRTLTVWEGEEYLAVRGTWTDQDLYNKIKEILESSI
jgi:hypothetical protein